MRCRELLAASSLAALILVHMARPARAQAPGALSAGHIDYKGPLDCVKCHEGGFGVPDEKCLGCHEHQPLRERIKAGKGFHADAEVKKKACKTCHAEHIEVPPGSGNGRKTTVDWTPFGGKRNFEHQRTGWPLQGAHRFQACEGCHKKQYKKTKVTTFLGLRGECITCHAKENPHEFTDVKLIDCTICHSFDNRKVPNLGVTKFDHDKTAFPLEGNHLRNACTACHKDLKRFKIEDRNFKDCSGCHKDSHRSVISATRKCQSCHDEKVKFAVTKFDHAKETKFPLRGQHGKNRCKDCHKIDSPPEKPKIVCSGCHQDIHKGRFGKETCDGCHPDGGPGWREMRYAHDKKTKFSLTGRHAEIFCTECHRNRDPKNFELHKTTNCADCHRHQEAHCGQFGLENCGRCHIRGGDRTSKFDHGLTRFPLERAHALVSCARCHKTEKLGDSARCKEAVRYTGLEPACLGCHEDVHRGDLGTDCKKCHTAGENFKTLVFDHNRDSRFALTGFHSIVPCATCHPERKFKLGDIQCVSCHKEDDVHAGALGDGCAKCHETTGGAPKFDHDLHTRFRREGVHARIECERCHFLKDDGTSEHGDKFSPAKGRRVSGVERSKPEGEEGPFASADGGSAGVEERAKTKAAVAPPGAPLDLKFRTAGIECGSCHPDPHRVREALVLDCDACHGFEGWPKPPRNDYHEKASFALTGAHAVIQCSLCHLGSGSLLGRGEACGSCHVQDDVHAGSLGSDCGRCHEQQGWIPTTFTHVDTGYVLEGVHRMLDCRSCHRAGNYFIGSKCYTCHLADFRAADFHRLIDFGLAQGKDKVPITGGDPGGATLDCDRCHNQFTFYAGTFVAPRPR